MCVCVCMGVGVSEREREKMTNREGMQQRDNKKVGEFWFPSPTDCIQWDLYWRHLQITTTATYHLQ